MTTEEILEGNKLIAEFMGCPLKKYKEDEATYIEYGEQQFASFDCEFSLIGGKPYGEDELKYHTSYDWLIPVIQKIQEEYNVVLSGISYIEHKSINKKVEARKANLEMWELPPIAEAVNGLSVQGIYSLVVDFIKWYNENNK